jgi:hypothetical protein
MHETPLQAFYPLLASSSCLCALAISKLDHAAPLVERNETRIVSLAPLNPNLRRFLEPSEAVVPKGGTAHCTKSRGNVWDLVIFDAGLPACRPAMPNALFGRCLTHCP